MPASAQMRSTPVSTPCDGSAGVDGVLTRHCRCVGVVDEEQVGERPSDVHAEAIRHLPSSLSGDAVRPRARRSAASRARARPARRRCRRPPSSARAWRIAPGVRLSFGTTPGTAIVPVHLVLVLDQQPALAEPRVVVDVLRPCRPARTRRRPSLTISSSSSAVCRGAHSPISSSSRSSCSPRAWWVAKRSSSPSSGVAHELRQPPPQRVVVGGDHDPLAVAASGRRCDGAMRGRRGPVGSRTKPHLLVLDDASTRSSRSRRRRSLASTTWPGRAARVAGVRARAGCPGRPTARRACRRARCRCAAAPGRGSR